MFIKYLNISIFLQLLVDTNKQNIIFFISIHIIQMVNISDILGYSISPNTKFIVISEVNINNFLTKISNTDKNHIYYEYNTHNIKKLLTDNNINAHNYIPIGDVVCRKNYLPKKLILVNKNNSVIPSSYVEIKKFNSGSLLIPISNNKYYTGMYCVFVNKGDKPNLNKIGMINKKYAEYITDFNLISPNNQIPQYNIQENMINNFKAYNDELSSYSSVSENKKDTDEQNWNPDEKDTSESNFLWGGYRGRYVGLSESSKPWFANKPHIKPDNQIEKFNQTDSDKSIYIIILLVLLIIILLAYKL